MRKAKDVTIEEVSTATAVSDGASSLKPEAEQPPRKPKKTKVKQKITPLPLRQLVPMTFVLLNESLCGTMLMPFIGYLVAYLQGRDPDDAGYFSGLLVGVFSVGQIVSARFWGKVSDKYGRRFPLISGLCAAGIMMLGFGLSGSLILCALCRFLQGTFNGNVLVAKTMMADITDKTNQAQGFAFVSFVSSIGLLIGPLLGGLLYDPTSDDSAMKFLHLDPEGIFGRRPALLPSLLIFFYSMVGMVVCTFFVQESNPDAQPIPHMYKLAFPCLLVPAKEFEPTPMAEPEYVTDSDAESHEEDGPTRDGARGKKKKKSREEDGSPESTSDNDLRETSSDTTDDSIADPRAEVSATFPVGALGLTSPIALEDTRRFDQLMEERWLRQRSSGNFSRSQSSGTFSASASMRTNNSSMSGSRHSRRHHHHHHRHHRVDGDAEVETPLSLRGSGSVGGTATINSFAYQLSASFAPENPLASRTSTAATGGVRREGKATDTTSRERKGESVILEDSLVEMQRGKEAQPPAEEAAVEVPSALLGREQTTPDSPVQAAVTPDGEDHEGHDDGTGKPKSFGYREAFSRPITRFMLVTYMILCGSDMTIKQCFPLWAISSVGKGGLGFSSSQVSYVLLFNSLPTLVSNFFFAIACRHYANKIGLFRVGLVADIIFGLWISMNSYVPVPFLKYVFVVICSAGQQFFSTWCYGLITMLTARAAPPGQVGTIMGINQSCGAIARSIVPVLTSPIYAWSISGNHIFPFNHVLVFYLASLSFVYCWYRSYSIKTINDTELVLVTGVERFGPVWLRTIVAKVRGMCGCKDDRNETEVTVMSVDD